MPVPDEDERKKAGLRIKRALEGNVSGKAVSTAVTILEPQPPNRYNIAFYADYEEKSLREGDKAYFTAFHESFPGALKANAFWDSRAPKSRVCCECHLIDMVPSLTELIGRILSFITDKEIIPIEGLEKKFGTILIGAHGNPEGLNLPIDKESISLSFKNLAIGLKNISALGKDCPKDWSEEFWKQVRPHFFRLDSQLLMLHKRQTWFDNDTLIKIWCCNLGREPKAGEPDPLRLFGETLVGGGGHVTVEAPRRRTRGVWDTYTGLRSGHYVKVFQESKKNMRWHPDIVAEVESKKDNGRLGKDDLQEAQKSFVDAVLRAPPTPGDEKVNWIPHFMMQKEDVNFANQGFCGTREKKGEFWRTVTV
jgi:hypothetical protein